MSFQNMTADEFNQALDRLGFKGRGKNNHPGDMGYAAFTKWLGAGRDRATRYGAATTKVPTDTALLLRLMVATGYTPEMVESLPPITAEISEQE